MRIARPAVPAALLLLLLLPLFAAACGGRSAPSLAATDVVVVDTAAPPEPELSTFALTLRIPRARLARVLDSLAPRAQEAKRTWSYSENVGFRYAWARSPLDVSFRGDTIHLATGVQYQLQACLRVTDARCWPRVGCGWSDSSFRPPALDGRIALYTRVHLSPSWRLETETRAAGPGFTYDETDRCRMSVARYDATPLLARRIRTAMDSIGMRFDAWVLQQVPLRARAAALWTQAQQPIDLGSGAWLVVAPVAAYAEPVGTDADGALRTSVAIQARPYLVVGPRPTVTAAPTVLPPLRPRDVPDSLHVALPVHADFAALNALLQESFVGDTVESDGRKYVVHAIEAAPAGRRVQLTADVDGFFRGRLVLVGTPVFDPATNRLVMPDLDYTLSTKNLLAKVGDALRHGTFRRRLQETTAWELGPQIDTARTQLTAALNRPVAPGVRVRGGIAQLRFTGVAVEADRVRVQLVADGAATVELDGP